MYGISKDEANKIVKGLKSPLFEGIDSDAIVANILTHFEKKEYGLNDTVVEFGDTGDCLFLVVHGAAAIKIGGKLQHTFTRGSILGEVCLVDETATRTATIVSASSKLIMLSIDRSAYDQIKKNMPLVVNQLTWNILKSACRIITFAGKTISLLQDENLELKEEIREDSREIPMIKDGNFFTRLRVAINGSTGK